MENILVARGLKKYYGVGNTLTKALDGVDLEVKKGEFVAPEVANLRCYICWEVWIIQPAET